ncbi:hypothetical protein [Roseovarius nubinhibens]|uniref:Lipoprotein n=1 Tax=Roseovarius nubinhibens (strain ATCC BAA-591 / DSM 15170 / ISM) TaxID=89187 RepID=A3SLV2_ROSNI|nr:hypothetical protein [Roseovarius nubinhibens]EAP78333.1 hypothetical protein ISM_08550 [Roseovarius nubinhibens ISM]
MRLKAIAWCCGAVLTLIGCTVDQSPGQLYQAGKPLGFAAYKAGATPETIKRDDLNCTIEATQRVPQNTQIRTTPTYAVPGRSYCRQVGGQTRCSITPPVIYGGNTYSYDANAGLRRAAKNQCMADLGYRPAQIPPCAEGITPQHLKSPGKGFPRLTRETCFIASESQYFIGEP